MAYISANRGSQIAATWPDNPTSLSSWSLSNVTKVKQPRSRKEAASTLHFNIPTRGHLQPVPVEATEAIVTCVQSKTCWTASHCYRKLFATWFIWKGEEATPFQIKKLRCSQMLQRRVRWHPEVAESVELIKERRTCCTDAPTYKPLTCCHFVVQKPCPNYYPKFCSDNYSNMRRNLKNKDN